MRFFVLSVAVFGVLISCGSIALTSGAYSDETVPATTRPTEDPIAQYWRYFKTYALHPGFQFLADKTDANTETHPKRVHHARRVVLDNNASMINGQQHVETVVVEEDATAEPWGRPYLFSYLDDVLVQMLNLTTTGIFFMFLFALIIFVMMCCSCCCCCRCFRC